MRWRALKMALALLVVVLAPVCAAAMGFWSPGVPLDGAPGGDLFVVPTPSTAVMMGLGINGLWYFGGAPRNEP